MVSDMPGVGGEEPTDEARIESQIAMHDRGLHHRQQHRAVGRDTDAKQQINEDRGQHEAETAAEQDPKLRMSIAA